MQALAYHKKPGLEVPLDPIDRVLDQPPRVEQVGRGFPDRAAPPNPGRERRTCDVLNVRLLAKDAFVRQGSL